MNMWILSFKKNRIEHSEGSMGPQTDQTMGDDEGFGHGLHPTALMLQWVK